jgi:hypothetical protein
MSENQRRLVLDEKRFVFYSKKLKELFGHSMELICALRYSSHHPYKDKSNAPMGVVGFQRVTPALRTTEWEQALLDSRFDCTSTGTLDGLIGLRLRMAVVSLMSEGYRSKEIGAILNIPATIAAAYMANETRGAYR